MICVSPTVLPEGYEAWIDDGTPGVQWQCTWSECPLTAVARCLELESNHGERCSERKEQEG